MLSSQINLPQTLIEIPSRSTFGEWGRAVRRITKHFSLRELKLFRKICSKGCYFYHNLLERIVSLKITTSPTEWTGEETFSKVEFGIPIRKSDGSQRDGNGNRWSSFGWAVGRCRWLVSNHSKGRWVEMPT